ncbi:MAG: methyltransferase, partial [Beijerinckiaceae bacterium]|nr:methyltransferase [Beijerinckiaceae bacterium]
MAGRINAHSSEISRRAALIGAASVAAMGGTFAQSSSADALDAAIAGANRSPNNRARDRWRAPRESLAFLGVQPNHTVVEILPGSVGYWLEILAPYLKDKGKYVAGGRGEEEKRPSYIADHDRLLAKLAADPATYGKVEVTRFNPTTRVAAPDASADFVLTFRNLHNWIERDQIEGALEAFRKALKPGGVLGVSDHRGRTDISQEAQMKTGYIRQDYAVALIEKAGFKLAGTSEAKANPKDTKDHPAGV